MAHRGARHSDGAFFACPKGHERHRSGALPAHDPIPRLVKSRGILRPVRPVAVRSFGDKDLAGTQDAGLRPGSRSGTGLAVRLVMGAAVALNEWRRSDDGCQVHDGASRQEGGTCDRDLSEKPSDRQVSGSRWVAAAAIPTMPSIALAILGPVGRDAPDMGRCRSGATDCTRRVDLSYPPNRGIACATATEKAHLTVSSLCFLPYRGRRYTATCRRRGETASASLRQAEGS
jgi:hypothetical protein